MKKTSKTEPFFSRILEREKLSKSGATKNTFHIVLDISEMKDSFQVGDSVGIIPSNDPKDVDVILTLTKASGSEEVFDERAKEFVNFKKFLTHRVNFSKISRGLLSLLVEKGAHSTSLLEALKPENKDQLTQFVHNLTLKDCLKLAPVTCFELAKNIFPMLPRFYSIANSPKMYFDEIHLLVSYLQYQVNGEQRVGIGSHFLCDLATVGSTPVPLYIQPSHNFTIPKDSNAPMIMIGPGTGVAPFRAFIQERLSLHAKGKNWLFFGERNRNSDFYYESFWKDLEKNGFLRLDEAFSRDSETKVYVQDKMLEQKKCLWKWIVDGAYIYVCGDAQNMAKEVELTLQKIIEDEGSLSAEESLKYLKTLRQEKRFLLDVY